MDKTLTIRAALITAMFGLFGGALVKLLKIDELQEYYYALTPLLALIVSFIISFLLNGKRTVKMRNKLRVISVVAFVGLLIMLFFHTRMYLSSTFRAKDFDDTVGFYVKGNDHSYTPAALKFKAEHPSITSDADLITEGFGGPDGKSSAWTQESIDNNILWLITSYSLVIILFVAILTMMLEILTKKESQTAKKVVAEEGVG
ncbi:MAG: hypothetical protein WAT91_00855 [Saprospiraceae bacterium]